jgi:hypothetical protein
VVAFYEGHINGPCTQASYEEFEKPVTLRKKMVFEHSRPNPMVFTCSVVSSVLICLI